jgi:hypothetical protein
MGCHEIFGGGIQGVPVNTHEVYPAWDWDGNLLTPSIRQEIVVTSGDGMCRSTLTEGIFKYHPDSTHSYSGYNGYSQRLPPDYVKSLEMQEVAYAN